VYFSAIFTKAFYLFTRLGKITEILFSPVSTSHWFLLLVTGYIVTASIFLIFITLL